MLGLLFVQKTKKRATARKTSLRYNERINAQGNRLLLDKRRKMEGLIILNLNNFSFVKTILFNNLGISEEQLPQKTVSRLSANCWPTVGRQLDDCWPTVSRLLAACR